jgi:hypothetical protein
MRDFATTDLRAVRRFENQDRFRRLAATAPTVALRDCLLSIARLYEIEADLVKGSALALAESREALVRADVALRRREHSPD